MTKTRLNFQVPHEVRQDLEECRRRSRSATMTEAMRRAIGAYGVLLAWLPSHEIIARDPATGQETRLHLV